MNEREDSAFGQHNGGEEGGGVEASEIHKPQRQDAGGKEEPDHRVEKLDPYEWRDDERGEEHEDSLRGKGTKRCDDGLGANVALKKIEGA